MANLIPEFDDHHGYVPAKCPDCETVALFAPVRNHNYGVDYYLLKSSPHHEGCTVRYQLFKCEACSRGGYGEIVFQDGTHWSTGTLEVFVPTRTPVAILPDGIPRKLLAELEEAGLCASVGAFRAACALLRSALEKTLIENGYRRGKLFHKIETAATEGVITQSRKTRAQAGVRVVGNDILHDDYRPVSQQEFLDAQLYLAKILEDLYEDREQVVKVLIDKGRLELADQ